VIGFGAIGMLTAAMIFFYVSSSRVAHTTGAGAVPHVGIRGWGIRNPQGFTALCLIEILDSSTRTGFLTFIAFLLIDKGIPDGWAALAVPLVLTGGMAGKLACGFLAERLGIIRTIVITEVATGLGILSTLALPGIGILILLPLLGVGLQGTSSVLYATIGDLVDKDRLPRAFGLFYTLGSLCGIAAPLGYGLVGDIAGVQIAIASVGVAVLVTLPFAAMLRPAIATTRPVSV
jgi:MFS family permease